MADEIVLGVKIKLDGREVDGQVRLLTEDVDRLSQAVRDQGAAAQQSAQLNGNLSQSVSDAGAASESAAQGMSRLAGFAKIAGAAIGTGIVALAGFAKNGIDAAAALQDMADRSGIAVEKLAGLELATQLADTSMDALIHGSNKLSINIAKNSADFAKLGISAKDPYEAMLQLSDVFAGIDDPQTRAAVGAKALGESYAELAPLLIQGSDALREQVAQGRAFSKVTAEEAQAAADFADNIDKLKLGLHGLSIMIGTEALPWINRLLEQMGAIPEGINTINQKIALQQRKVATLRNEGGIGGLIDGLLGYDINEELRKLEVLQKQKEKLTAPLSKPTAPASSAIQSFIAENDKAKTAADRAAKAEANRREEITKTIAQIQQETALIGLSDRERSRALELTQALTKAKGAEVAAITEALDVKWKEMDAEERRQEVIEDYGKQLEYLDDLRKSASQSEYLANLAKELQSRGLNNEEIRKQIDLEKELADTIAKNPDLDPEEVRKRIQQRIQAQKQLEDITDNGSQKTADFMEAAWKRAAENIQDSMSEMFENLLNGDATKSFSDFFNNIKQTMAKTLGQIMAQNFQGMIQRSFTNGGGGVGFDNLFGGIGDWFKRLFGGSDASTMPGYSSNPAFSGPPDSSYFGSNNLLGNIFSMGKSGGFSMSSSGGGGFGWGALASLANLIPGAGQVSWKGQQQNKSLETVVGMENMVTDMVGNFFPLFKLVAPLKNMIMNFGADLFPDRKPSLMGHMLGQAFGPLGDLLGTFLLGSKIPQPTEYTRGRYSNGRITVGKSEAFEGGNTRNTIDFTSGFGDMITALGHQLDMTFRDFNTNFWHQLDKGGDNQFAAFLSDKGGNFLSRNLSEGGDFKTLANQASLAVIKRNIASQDDLHYRDAIRDSKSLKKLSAAIEDIDKIGTVIGEYGEALQSLKQINAEFDDMAIKARKYRFAEVDIEAARQRAIEALKNDTLSAFRQLAGLGPTLAAQIGALNNQLIAVTANARSLKIAETDLVGLREKAITVAKEQFLAPLTDVSGSIADQIASLTGVFPTPEDVAPLYQLLAASTDPTEQARYIERIQRALSQRYNIEIAQINKVAGAVNNLKAFVDGLKLSDLSPLDPLQRFQEAKGQYGTKLLKAQAGDQAAIADLPNAAQSYLQEARSYYASTPEYASIFDNVTSTLESLGASMGGIDTSGQDAASAAANTLAASLTQLNDVVKELIANQGAAFNQQAGNIVPGAQSPAKDFRDITEDQMAANIDALPDDATKAQKKAVQALNKQLASQIKAWLFGGEEELAKTQAYQELTGAIKDIQAEIKATKKGDPQRNYLRAQLSGLMAQRKALGKVKFKEQGGWTDGPTIVGENGPELINFARPTQVQSNRQTQSIIAGGNDAMIAELRKQTEELTALVRLQAASNQELIEQMQKMAVSMGSIERKTRLAGAA